MSNDYVKFIIIKLNNLTTYWCNGCRTWIIGYGNLYIYGETTALTNPRIQLCEKCQEINSEAIADLKLSDDFGTFVELFKDCDELDIEREVEDGK